MPTPANNTNREASSATHSRARLVLAWFAELAAWAATQNENARVPPPETNTSISVFVDRLNSELNSQPSQPLPTPTEVADDYRAGALPAEVLPDEGEDDQPPQPPANLWNPSLQQIEVRVPRLIGLRLYPVMQGHMQHRFGLRLLVHKDRGDDRWRLVLRGGNRLFLEEAAKYLEDLLNDIARYLEEYGEFASVTKW